MIYPAGRYNLNFDICAIVMAALLLLYLTITQNLHVRRVRLLFWVTLCMLLCSAGELGMDITRNDNGIAFQNWQAEIATFISHLAHNTIPFLLMIYFLALTGIWHGMKRSHFMLISIPEIFLIVDHVIPPVRHLIYYYYGNCRYVRGPLYGIYTLVVMFYVACSAVILVRHASSIQKREWLYVIILSAGFLGGMVIGIIDTYVRVTNFIQTLVLICTFFVLENDDKFLDHLTGVYNTAGLMRDSYPLFRAKYRSYVLSIKLQHFNYYRLMVGMNAMTEILRRMGAWMLGNAYEERTFYRIGNGEFAVILFNSTREEAINFANKLSERFEEPWQYSGSKADLTVPAQIWVSSIPDRISTEEQVLAFAESSFDDDLPQGQVFVADEMKEEQRRTDVNVAIRRAIAENGFDVYYQPIYDTSNGKIHSCEALVRMTDQKLGPVSPEEFIKVAEQTGTISKIGSIVFEKVCRFISEEKPERYGMDFIEVNLSPIQCMDKNLAAEFDSIMKKYGVKPSQIVLEITESAVIHNEGRFNQVLENLKNEGFLFALDDFGTGQSNYSYIRKIPFSIIKIDKSFLWAADKNMDDRVVLRNMLSLVKDLKKQTVVEGVETRAHRDHLVEGGVNYLQGYYYSKPVPGKQFLTFVKNFNSGTDAAEHSGS